jgi:hypothetical protein
MEVKKRMKLLKEVVNINKPTDSVLFAFFGDPHPGDKNFDSDRFWQTARTLVKMSKRIPTYCFVMGDLANAVISHPDEKRMDYNEMDRKRLTIGEQYDASKDVLKYLAKNLKKGHIVVVLCGNHDETLRKRTSFDFVKNLAELLDLPYGGYNALVTFEFVFKKGQKKEYRVYVAHGSHAPRTVASKLNACLALANVVEADAYAMGHHHIKFYYPRTLIASENNKMKEVTKDFILTGSFLRGYPEGATSTYVEQAALPPNTLGGMAIRYWPATGERESMEI